MLVARRNSASGDSSKSVVIEFLDRSGDTPADQNLEHGRREKDGVRSAVLGNGDRGLKGSILIAPDILLKLG